MSEATFEEQVMDRQLVSIEMPFLENGENPSGKCDDWNEQFTKKVIGEGLDASVIGEANLGETDKQGNMIRHHAITVGFSKEKNRWLAADLSAAQIQGHNEPFYVEADSLVELTDKVKEDLGGNWKALNDEAALRQEMARQKSIFALRNKGK